MQNPKNLRVTERARSMAVEVYRTTAAFPASERFGLTAQMRRAAVSVGSNIAEGCGRRSNRELRQYLYIAMGSASELQFQCELASELAFGDPAAVASTSQGIDRLKGMLARLITRLPQQPPKRTKDTDSLTH